MRRAKSWLRKSMIVIIILLVIAVILSYIFITKEPVRNFVNISNVTGVNERGAYDINTELNGSVTSENRKIGAYIFAAHRTRSPYDRDKDRL